MMVKYQFFNRNNLGEITVLKELSKGDIIGEINLFNGQAIQLSARSQDFTTVIKIDREQFIEVIKNNQKDFQKFNEIKDKVVLYSNLKSLNLKCLICQSQLHLQEDCPLCHIRLKNSFHFAKINKSIEQERNGQFQRQQKTSFNAYLDMFDICQSVNQILDEYQFLTQVDVLNNSFDNLSNLDDDDDDEDDDNDDEEEEVLEDYEEQQPQVDKNQDDQSVGTYSKVKENSFRSNQINNPNQMTALLNPVLDQQNQIYGLRQRRTSRDHTFLQFQDKNHLQLYYNGNSYQQLDSNVHLGNNYDLLSVDRLNSLPIPSQQFVQRGEENSQHREQTSSTNLRDPSGQQNQPIISRRKKDLTIIRQLKTFMKDHHNTNREGTIHSNSQSRNRQNQKLGITAENNQYQNMQQIEKIKQQNFFWYFDQQKDYLYYFPEGNMHSQILKFSNQKKKNNIKDKNVLNHLLSFSKDSSPTRKRIRLSRSKIKI